MLVKRREITLLLMALIAIGAGLSAEVSSAAEKIGKAKLVFANVCSTGSMLDACNIAFIEKIAELSQGAITVDYFPDAILGTEAANQSSMQTGALDMAALSSSLMTLVPKLGIFDFPYFITDRSQMVQLEKAGILDQIRSDAAEKGIIILSFGENGFRHITNNTRPITLPEDLAGLKIRTPNNNIRLETFKALNANPTPLSFSELYQALQQGVVDGQENPLSQIRGSRLYEVQKYLSLSNHIYSPNYVCISKKVWDKFSPEQQAVLKEAGIFNEVYNRDMSAKSDEETVAYLEQEGMNVNACNAQAFQAALMPLWDSLAADAGAEFVENAKAVLGY